MGYKIIMNVRYDNFKKEVGEHLKSGWLKIGETQLQQKIIDANKMIFCYEYMQAMIKKD